MTEQRRQLSEKQQATLNAANKRVATALGLIVVGIYIGYILYNYL